MTLESNVNISQISFDFERFMNTGGPGTTSDYDQFSRANCIKKGAMFGFALGMLAGLIWIGIAPPEEAVEMGPASTRRWGKIILAGIGLGMVDGAAWPKPKETSPSTDDSQPSTDH